LQLYNKSSIIQNNEGDELQDIASAFHKQVFFLDRMRIIRISSLDLFQNSIIVYNLPPLPEAAGANMKNYCALRNKSINIIFFIKN